MAKLPIYDKQGISYYADCVTLCAAWRIDFVSYAKNMRTPTLGFVSTMVVPINKYLLHASEAGSYTVASAYERLGIFFRFS